MGSSTANGFRHESHGREVAHEEQPIGIVLSGATTSEAACQLLETAERGKIVEGMLVIVKTQDGDILARVTQIVPHNEFYTEGDAWSEARRKGLPIPEDVARKYEICKIELLMQLPKRIEVKYPPQPGQPVFLIDPVKHTEQIFGVTRQSPGYVWYGSLGGYDSLPVPFNTESVPMHLAIFGVTGSGKSFDTGALIEKLVEIPTGRGNKVSYPMIVVDAHGDYTDYVKHVSRGNKLGHVGWIKRYVFPLAYANPELRQKGSLTAPIAINLDSISQREMAELIILFYKGTVEGSELAVEYTNGLFDFMKNSGYDSRQEIFLRHFSDLMDSLELYARQVDMHPATKGAIRRSLEVFRTIEDEHKLLSTESELKQVKLDAAGSIEEVTFVDKVTREGGLAIFDFSADGAPGVDLKTKQLVMVYLSAMLFAQFTNYRVKREDRYLLFIIEEAQNFVPDKSYPIGTSLAHAKLSAIATQGRKFGLSLCLISQRPSFVDRIVLSMANTFLIHRVAPEDVSFVKTVSGGLPPSLLNRLTKLATGDLIISGQMLTTPFPLFIHVSKSDRQVPHTIGQTNVIRTLSELRGS